MGSAWPTSRLRRSAPDHASIHPAASDLHPITYAKIGVGGLGDGNQNAVIELHRDVLPGPAVNVVVLDIVSGNTATERAQHHRDVPAGTCADQAADPDTGCSPYHRAQTKLMVAGKHHRLNTNDFSKTYFLSPQLRSRGHTPWRTSWRRGAAKRNHGQRYGGD